MHGIILYFRSLKHILTKNIIHSSNINHFIKKSKSSYSIKLQPD